MHIHVGVKQPHGRSRRVRRRPSGPPAKLAVGMSDRKSDRYPPATCHLRGTPKLGKQPAAFLELPASRPRAADRRQSSDTLYKPRVASPTYGYLHSESAAERRNNL